MEPTPVEATLTTLVVQPPHLAVSEWTGITRPMPIAWGLRQMSCAALRRDRQFDWQDEMFTELLKRTTIPCGAAGRWK